MKRNISCYTFQQFRTAARNVRLLPVYAVRDGVSFQVIFLRLYFIYVYSLDGAIEPWLERPACDKQRSASFKFNKVLKCAQPVA